LIVVLISIYSEPASDAAFYAVEQESAANVFFFANLKKHHDAQRGNGVKVGLDIQMVKQVHDYVRKAH